MVWKLRIPDNDILVKYRVYLALYVLVGILATSSVLIYVTQTFEYEDLKQSTNAIFVTTDMNNVTGVTGTVFLLKGNKQYFFPHDNPVWTIIYSNCGGTLQMFKDGILTLDQRMVTDENPIEITSFQHFINIMSTLDLG